MQEYILLHQVVIILKIFLDKLDYKKLTVILHCGIMCGETF
jgi:hypothetical protein